MELGIVSGEIGVADGSFLPSNVSWDSRYEAVETVEHSTVKYMKELLWSSVFVTLVTKKYQFMYFGLCMVFDTH